jgi:methionyl-tRNA synthetase
MDVQAFHEALDRIWTLVRAANGYVDRQAPWTLRKTDPARMRTVLYVLSEAIRHLGILMLPVVPESAGRMLDQLAVGPEQRTFAFLGPEHALIPGTALPKPEPVFPRHVEAEEGRGGDA